MFWLVRLRAICLVSHGISCGNLDKVFLPIQVHVYSWCMWWAQTCGTHVGKCIVNHLQLMQLKTQILPLRRVRFYSGQSDMAR